MRRLDAEVLSVLRGLVLAGRLDPGDAVRAREEHFAFTINRHETAPLADRIWQLRHQFTAYDASYLAPGRGASGASVHLRRKAEHPRPQRGHWPDSTDAVTCAQPGR